MASRHQCTHSIKTAFIVQDLTDDATDIIPVIGLKTSMSLKNRFIGRLGELIGQEMTLEEIERNESIKIHIRRNTRSGQDEHLIKLLGSMKGPLGIIAVHSAGMSHLHKPSTPLT